MKLPAILLGIGLVADVFAAPNFSDHVLPVFRNACTNCHNPDKKKAGLDLTTYQALMAGGDSGAVVVPGNAEGSLLYLVSAHTKEPTMPPKGDKLGEADLKLLKDWIAAFALETASSKPMAVKSNAIEASAISLRRPDGPAPMPGEMPLEAFIKTPKLGAMTTLAASPWAPLVAVGGQKQVFLYHVESLSLLGVLAFPEGFPNVLRFSRNAKLLLAGGGVGGKSGRVVVWDVKSGARVAEVGDESDAVLAADLSADQRLIALGGTDKKVKIFRIKDGMQTGLIKKHTEWITAVTYSPDGEFLATADRNGGIELWENEEDPKPFNTLAGHPSAVNALSFMPGVLASGSEDGKITLWNVKEGVAIRSWDAHPGGVLWVDFAPDGRLVSSGRDKMAKVWDMSGKALVKSEGFRDIATRAVLNGARMFAADWTGEIGVFVIQGAAAQKVGALSAAPPDIAQQLADAESRYAEKQKWLAEQKKLAADVEMKLKAEREAMAAKSNAEIQRMGTGKLQRQKHLDELRQASENAEKQLGEVSAQAAAIGAGSWNAAMVGNLFIAAQRAVFENAKEGFEKARISVAAEMADADAKIEKLRHATQNPQPIPLVKQTLEAKERAQKAQDEYKAAEREVLHWKRAAIFKKVYDKQSAVARIQSRHDEKIAAAGAAFLPVEKAKQSLALLEKKVADGPLVIAEREKAMNVARQAYEKSLAAVEAAKQEVEATGRQVPDLAARIVVLNEEGGKAKSVAESEAAKIREELNASKRELDRLRMEYEAAKAVAEKP